jgi:thioesterase domain-containing protein
MPPRAEIPLARTVRSAGPDRNGTLVWFHPGALPASVYGPLFDAVPLSVELHLVDLSGLAEYARAALTGGRPATSITAMAEHCRKALDGLDLGPGPRVLAGWSYGGVIAHALSTLPAGLPDVHQLLLVDAIAPLDDLVCPSLRTRGPEAEEEAMVLGWFVMYLGAKRRAPVPLAQSAFEDLSVDEGLELILRIATRTGALHSETSIAGLRKLYDTFYAGLARNGHLNVGHAPRRTTLPVTLVRPAQGLLTRPPLLGWDALATDEVRLLHTPGNHYTMLTDPDAIALLSGLVREWLLPVGATEEGIR